MNIFLLLIVLFVFCLIHFGLRSETLDKDSPFIFCLDDSSIIVIRSKTNHNSINASIIRNIQIENQLELKKTVRHFYLNDSCLHLKTNSQEMINFWIIPKNLCPNLNIVNDYGYSYHYTIKMMPNIPTCLFFQSLTAKHHITITPFSTDLTLKTDIYNTQSLRTKTPLLTFSDNLQHSFSDSEPFFLRLLLASPEPKMFRVSLVSLNFPILYSNCKAEEIQQITSIDSEGTRHQPPNIQSSQCVNVIDELKLFLIIIVIGLIVFIIIIIIFHFSGCISIRFFYGICQFKGRYDGPKKVVMSTSHKNSMDIDASIDRHSDVELLT